MLAPLGPEGPGAGSSPGGGGSSPSAPVSPSGGRGAAAEVETEFEDEGYDEEGTPAHQPVDEVDEELESSSAVDGGSEPGPRSGGDYVVPAANREVWKQFGYNTEAGRALRRLYKSGSQSDASSMLAYPRMPSPSQKWEPKPAPRKPCPQRTAVKVPRARREEPDPEDPRNWRMPLPGRRPGAEILAEMQAAKIPVPVLPKGRDHAAEKDRLQGRFQFCGGRALPPGAMGNVESGAMPEAAPSYTAMHQERQRRDENGMNAEHREIFEELMLAVKRKQARVAEIEAEEANEGIAKGPSKARTARNKEALELRNDIDRCLKDIDKLIELTET